MTIYNALTKMQIEMKGKKIIKTIAIILASLIAVVFTFAKYKHISPISLNMHDKINQAVFSDEAIEG